MEEEKKKLKLVIESPELPKLTDLKRLKFNLDDRSGVHPEGRSRVKRRRKVNKNLYTRSLNRIRRTLR